MLHFDGSVAACDAQLPIDIGSADRREGIRYGRHSFDAIDVNRPIPAVDLQVAADAFYVGARKAVFDLGGSADPGDIDIAVPILQFERTGDIADFNVGK